MSRIACRPQAWMFIAATLTACGGGEAGELAPETGLDAPDRTLAVAPDPVFSVGGFDAPEWATFGNVQSVALDARGHLFIFDSQTNTVTEVNATGEFVQTIGRSGEGPGEISTPFAFALTPEGGVAVFDFGHQAFVVYDAQGEYVRNVRIDVADVGIPGRDLSAHPNGGVVGPITGRMRMSGPGADDEDEAEPEAPSRPIAYFGLAEGDSARVVYSAWDLPPAPDGDQQRLSTSGGGSLQIRMQALRAFEPGLHAAVLRDGRIAVVDSVGYRIKFIDLEGQVQDVLERPQAPTVVTPAIQEAERARRIEEAQEQGGGTNMVMITRSGGGGGTQQVDNDAVRRMMEGRLESMIFAEEIPVIEDMAADWDGRIWVQRSAGEPGEIGPTDLLTVDGRYLGTIPADGVRIPRAFGPNGLMVRIEEDEFDVPTVIVERMPAEIR